MSESVHSRDENDQPAEPKRREIKSFVLRQGRMTTGQQRGLEECWDKWGLKLEDGPVDMTAAFDREAPVVLEIGYGMGLSLVAMASAETDKNFIGVEVHRPGVGSLLNEAATACLTNVRTYNDDAVEVLKQCIPDGSLSRVQVYFPDPWHKKRHNKRRLVQPKFIELLRPKLKVGGVIHMATDWEHYAEQMMEVMSDTEGFKNMESPQKYSPRPEFRPLTKFERRGQRLGHGVWDLLFERIS